MKDFTKQIVVLTIISVVVAVALAGVNRLTADKIEEQQRLKLVRALESVLPSHDNEPDKENIDVAYNGQNYRFYIAKKKGEFVGCAVKTWSDAGYGGRIEVLTGILPTGDVQNVIIVFQRETPGLGTKITMPSFLEKIVFKDRIKSERRNLKNTDWRVRKDGGEIDQITGATISPRAVVSAVKLALELFEQNRSKIVEDTQRVDISK